MVLSCCIPGRHIVGAYDAPPLYQLGTRRQFDSCTSGGTHDVIKVFDPNQVLPLLHVTYGLQCSGISETVWDSLVACQRQKRKSGYEIIHKLLHIFYKTVIK